MIALTLTEVADIVGGRLADITPEAAARTRVTGTVEFDSRAVTPGGLFLALPGERADGHDFVNVDVHTEPDTTISTYAGGGSLALSFNCDTGSGVTIWLPIDRVEELALAILAKAAEYRAEYPAGGQA